MQLSYWSHTNIDDNIDSIQKHISVFKSIFHTGISCLKCYELHLLRWILIGSMKTILFPLATTSITFTAKSVHAWRTMLEMAQDSLFLTLSRIRLKYLEPKYSICYFTENGVFPYIDMGKKTKTSNSIKNFPGMFPSTLFFLNF